MGEGSVSSIPLGEVGGERKATNSELPSSELGGSSERYSCRRELRAEFDSLGALMGSQQ